MLTVIRSFPRIWQILTVLFHYMALPQVRFWDRDQPAGPVRVRLALETLGGAWIKLGQTLALRFDLLPPAYCYELFKLLNQVHPFAYEAVREIIKAELGDYPEVIFRSFEPESFAAASIGQVHKGVLPGGERVVVKVQRPNIRQIIYEDIALMYVLSAILDFSHLLGNIHSRQIVDEFVYWVTDELDYLKEGRNASKLCQNAAAEKYEKNARVYWDYTSSRVLTTELIEGIPLIQVVEAIGNDDTAYLQHLQTRGYSLQQIAQHMDVNMLNQIYVHGYFHADLHPANIFILPDHVIAYVDFGIVGRLSNELRASLLQYTLFFFRGDTDRSIKQLMRWVIPSPQTNIEAARRDLVRIHEDYLFAFGDEQRRSGKEATSAFTVNVLNTVRRHKMMLSSSVIAYMRTLVTMASLRYELDPNYDLPGLTNQFFNRLMAQKTCEFLKPGELAQYAFNYGFRLRNALDQIEAGNDSSSVAMNEAIEKIGCQLRLIGVMLALISLTLLYLLISSNM